jgi:hypothetical protein
MILMTAMEAFGAKGNDRRCSCTSDPNANPVKMQRMHDEWKRTRPN